MAEKQVRPATVSVLTESGSQVRVSAKLARALGYLVVESESKGHETKEDTVKAPERAVSESDATPKGIGTPKTIEVVSDESGDVSNSVVRKWAQENDVPVSTKGRISQDVWDAYNNAH